MKIDDFSFIKCESCGNVKFFPIPYEDNYALLSNMCEKYNNINECCNNPDTAYCDIEYGIKMKLIKLSDLPLKLRKEFPPEVTHKFDCGEHSLVVTKYNGDTVSISIEGTDLIIDDERNITTIHLTGEA